MLLAAGRSRWRGKNEVNSARRLAIEIGSAGEEVLWAGLRCDIDTVLPAAHNFLGRLAAGYMHDGQTRCRNFGQRNRAVRGFPFHDLAVGNRMVAKVAASKINQALAGPADCRIIL